MTKKDALVRPKISKADETYCGDDALARLLTDAGSAMTVAELRQFLAGVDAAPPAEDPEAWVRLVVEAPSDALRAQLRAFRRLLEAERDGAEKTSGAGERMAARLAALRQELDRRGLGGFVVPRADEHQGEYVPPRAERLAWLTGFTGSAGVAVVLQGRAAIFVDGRYTLQVVDQVDVGLFEPRHLIEQPAETWIAENLPAGGKLGYDPWLHTVDGTARLRRAVERAGGELVACAENPLDAVWPDQPPPPVAPVVPHEMRFAGQTSAEKRATLGQKLKADGFAAAVLTAPDSIAWLLNIRGGDVPHTPLPLSFAILHADGAVELFIDRRKLVPGLDAHLGNGVAVSPPDGFAPALDRLGQARRRVVIDGASAAVWIFDRLSAAGAQPISGEDPCALPKACKNETEIAGARAAHRRDGAAVTRFLAWLAREGPAGKLTEIAAAERLAAFRRENELFRDFSFDTISGAGPNGAIVHYRVTERTDRRLEPGQIYLVDSGAQYLDGTTDITRTVAVGTLPSGAAGAEMRDRFTRVLKGHIALATARFPRGTTGSQLDTPARLALWQAGLDYDHGTGHGVGSYLGVHEGPQRISKVPNRVPLEVGMIVSNEPGYYKTGAYGIRIENLVTVVPAEGAEVDAGERPTLGFETLTLAPIDRTLIEPALLSPAEVAWLDAYHRRVRETLTPLVDEATAAWLVEVTRPLEM
ncbi:M24 family metallopeptidase [Rhodospirillaceae bacterium SYSU D60014]|uniref:aminopeptidase P family protein n=1 Tax=Virgifigura deserti TaxID=2268457 RepID=UPI000E666A01